MSHLSKSTNPSSPSDKNSAKKAAVLKTTKKSRCKKGKSRLMLLGGGLLVIGAGIALFFDAGSRNAPPAAATAPSDEAVYPLALFDDGKARHFEHVDDDGKAIRYFILKSSDGVVRAAFDACDVCWPAGKGYYQEGDVMVCRNCGRRFASVGINEIKGGCNPAPLRRSVSGTDLVIRVTDILEGRSYFDFPSSRGQL